MVPSSPTFTGFKGLSTSKVSVLGLPEIGIGEDLTAPYTADEDNFVAIYGDNLDLAQMSDFSSDTAGVYITGFSQVEGTYLLSITLDADVTEDFGIYYKGTLLFGCVGS